MTLNELFKNTTYDDTLFSVEDKSTIESRIFMKSVRGSEVPYITCAIRDKEIKLTPEEAVRQLYIYKLMKLFNNNLDVVDDAFEYLMSKAQKGEKGQYFTPRYVIDRICKTGC